LGKIEILLQQPIAEEAAIGVWKDPFLPPKPHLPKMARRKDDLLATVLCTKRPQNNAKCIQEQEFVQSMNRSSFSIEVEPHRIERQLTESNAFKTLQFNPNDSGSIAEYRGRVPTCN